MMRCWDMKIYVLDLKAVNEVSDTQYINWDRSKFCLDCFFCILRPETEQTATLKRSAMKKYLKRECEMEDG